MHSVLIGQLLASHPVWLRRSCRSPPAARHLRRLLRSFGRRLLTAAHGVADVTTNSSTCVCRTCLLFLGGSRGRWLRAFSLGGNQRCAFDASSDWLTRDCCHCYGRLLL
jgi:hypothetical protein